MKVAELIDILKKHDQNLEVLFPNMEFSVYHPVKRIKEQELTYSAEEYAYLDYEITDDTEHKYSKYLILR